MNQTTKIAIFKGKGIRKTIYKNEWWFSVVDVIEALTGTDRPRKYWNDLKKKLIKEGYAEVSEKIGQLKLEAPDGKLRETDCGNTETIFRIIQTIPSPKAEPFKRWLARVGYERVQEIEDPELYYDFPTLELTKTGGKKIIGGYELPELWIGSFEIYSTSGAICANEPYCEKVDKFSFSIKGKSYSTDIFERQVWESGKFTGNYFYVFQIGSQSELDSIPSKPTITGQYETTAEKLEIENILSSITY